MCKYANLKMGVYVPPSAYCIMNGICFVPLLIKKFVGRATQQIFFVVPLAKLYRIPI